MPQGSIEHGYWAISASPFKVTKNLSAANVETVGVASGLVKDGVIDLNQPSKEAVKVNEERQIRSNVGRTVWDYMRPLLDFSAYGK